MIFHSDVHTWPPGNLRAARMNIKAAKRNGGMQSLTDILKNIKPTAKEPTNRITREFQSYGLFLAEKLGDTKHKALYIRLAKIHPRNRLERAYRYVIDSNARNKGALFMWKLKQMSSEVKT